MAGPRAGGLMETKMTARPRRAFSAALAFGLVAASCSFAAFSPARADVLAGVTAWEAGDYARAVAEWRPLALAGNADAQFNLGQAYKLGRGVEQNWPQAVEWYRRAAEQGHLRAQDNMGLVLYELNRKAEALPWLERSAARGEPRAQFLVGAELYRGEIVTQDFVRAYALMKRASDAGLQRASAGLVQMDQAIPLEIRRQGLQLAEQLEQSEGQARLAAMTNALPPAPPNQPSNVRVASLPPSAPGVSYTPPPIGVDPASLPPAPATPAARPAVAAPAPVPPRAAPPAASGGAWRVQLGAFSSRANAQALWSRLSARLAGAQPSYVVAGSATRLQAGPYASRAAAEAACGAVRPNGCFAVQR